jgi:putative transposase
MPRKARIVSEGMPHHVTQRGNRRQNIFFTDEDRIYYLDCLRQYTAKYNVSVISYCLMTNHVHHILVPGTADGLHKVMKSVHAKYAFRINRRNKWIGHLWQARYFSSILGSSYLLSAVRYVELNPVKAKLVKNAGEYRWSSAAARLAPFKDPLLDYNSLWNDFLPDAKQWHNFLEKNDDDSVIKTLRENTAQNIPCGDSAFIESLEAKFGRTLKFRNQGRPNKR